MSSPDIPLPPQGSTNWFAWASEQEDLSDAGRTALQVSGGGLTDATVITQAAYNALGAGRPAGRIYFIIG